MTTRQEDGIIRYRITIDFVEPASVTFTPGVLPPRGEDREALKRTILEENAESIRQAAERIRELLQTDAILEELLTGREIVLQVELSH
jgi:hypothetical protein